MLQQRPTTPLLKQEVLIAQHIVLCKSRLLHTAPADGNNPLMFSTHHLLEVTPIRKQRQENWKGFYAKAEGLLKYPLPSSKGIILRSIQRIICSLHTHEPEMKISKLARRVWDNLRRAMYGRIGMQRIQVPLQFINKYVIAFQTQIRYWIFEILYLILDMGWYCIFSFFGIHTSRHSTVPADEKYKAPGTFSGGCKTFVHMSKNLLDIRVLCLLKQEMSCHLFQGNSRQKFSTHHLLSAYS